MRIFYDTEFFEDGLTITPISIGMVREDGAELYHVNESIDCGTPYARIRRNRWLMENVVRSLPLRSGSYQLPGDDCTGRFQLNPFDVAVRPLGYIAAAVARFVLGTPEPELWAWYAAYDHVLLAQLFGRMIDLPTGFPMHTCDLKQEADRVAHYDERARELPPLTQDGGQQHNALHDAREVRYRFEYLRGFGMLSGHL